MSRRDPYNNLLEYYADVDKSDTDSANSEASSLTDFEWEDYWMDAVRGMYDIVQQHNLYADVRVMPRSSLADFFEFCYQFSSHVRPKLSQG